MKILFLGDVVGRSGRSAVLNHLPSLIKKNNIDFTVINACSQVDEDWERHGLNSEVAVVFNVEKKAAIIFGTWYVVISFSLCQIYYFYISTH